MPISSQESLLGQVVRESDVRPGKLAQQTSHGRLVPADQFAEGMLVFIDKNASNEVRIG